MLGTGVTGCTSHELEKKGNVLPRLSLVLHDEHNRRFVIGPQKLYLRSGGQSNDGKSRISQSRIKDDITLGEK